ncbi:phosphate/phosphite/phosphonate ABC transporter substrate-binding protein [Desulfobacterales bacterium HSG17]|nr:phosphate/phosphite/phosphonate ABC transporter substrate-binding protein [Desulfobacterales bacterium HSG17]
MQTNRLIILKHVLLVFGTLSILSTEMFADTPDTTLTTSSYSFGIVPQQSATKLARLWGPLLLYLEKETGHRFYFKTEKSIPLFEQRLAEGIYDFAYMNPYHYTVFHNNPGYEAFAKQAEKMIKGIIVVRKDSPIKSLEELKAQKLAFPAPAAFAASVLTRAHFQNAGIPIIPQYVSSHDSVYRTVEKGIFIAGGGIQRTLKNMDPNGDRLKVLWETKPYTPHAFAAHPRIDTSIVLRVQSVLIEMQNNEAGNKILSGINFKGIAAANNNDWNDVRALGIELLNHLTSQ